MLTAARSFVLFFKVHHKTTTQLFHEDEEEEKSSKKHKRYGWNKRPNYEEFAFQFRKTGIVSEC